MHNDIVQAHELKTVLPQNLSASNTPNIRCRVMDCTGTSEPLMNSSLFVVTSERIVPVVLPVLHFKYSLKTKVLFFCELHTNCSSVNDLSSQNCSEVMGWYYPSIGGNCATQRAMQSPL